MSGCDDGLKIVGMEISQYPDTIVYIKGEAEELDFTGIVIAYQLKGGQFDFGVVDKETKKMTVS